MKSTLFLAFVCGSAVAQNLDFADQSPKISRNFCCTLYDAKAKCHDRCQGQPCDSMCESRCGIANSLCGRWPCQEVNSSGCTTTTTPTPPTPPTCAASGATCCPAASCATPVECCPGLSCFPSTGTTALTCQ